jgi:ABC-type antimicrobial peptide transport system permease subunit
MRVTGDTTWRTIVGVVSGIRDEEIAEGSRPHMYTPLQQTPAVRPTIMIRSDDDPRTVLASVRRILTEMEPGAPIASVKPLTEVVSTGLGDRRLTEMLLAGFALLAVTLAAVGIYGVMSLYVANRKREFGIRLAVGAEPGTLVRLVMIEGLALAATGVAFGLVGGLGAARWLRTLLYEVSPTDPVVFATLAVGLLAVALASCYAPARRAAKADPLVALRAD